MNLSFIRKSRVVIFIASLFLFVLVVVLCGCLVIRESIKNRENTTSSRFQYYERNNQFSKFGTTMYECEGFCYCESEDENIERRNIVGSPFVRGISVLVASISSVLAIQYAKRDFDQKCHDIMTKSSSPSIMECPPNAIISEVDECKPLDDENTRSEETDSESPKDSTKVSDGSNERYICKGRCMTAFIDDLLKQVHFEQLSRLSSHYPDLDTIGLSEKVSNRANEIMCEQYEHESEFDYAESCERYQQFLQEENIQGHSKTSHTPDQISPKFLFMMYDLYFYCEKLSHVDLFELMGSSAEKALKIVKQKIPMEVIQGEFMDIDALWNDVGKAPICTSIGQPSSALADHNSGIGESLGMQEFNPTIVCRKKLL